MSIAYDHALPEENDESMEYFWALVDEEEKEIKENPELTLDAFIAFVSRPDEWTTETASAMYALINKDQMLIVRNDAIDTVLDAATRWQAQQLATMYAPSYGDDYS